MALRRTCGLNRGATRKGKGAANGAADGDKKLGNVGLGATGARGLPTAKPSSKSDINTGGKLHSSSRTHEWKDVNTVAKMPTAALPVYPFKLS